MKKILSYKLFEKIHPINTNINELSDDFINDIMDICSELNDEFPIDVNFYSLYFLKNRNLDYPVISIILPWSPYGYTFGEVRKGISKECLEIKETALRIKNYLGDSYKEFNVSKNGNIIRINLNNNTKIDGISGIEIVYDPTNFKKDENI